MDYIVNNTGIPSSEWGKYKPAGTKSTTVDFTALAKSADGEGELKELVSRLSDGSRATLKRLKSNPNFISKRKWLDLTTELNHMGVVSDADYMAAGGLFQLVPIGDLDIPTH